MCTLSLDAIWIPMSAAADTHIPLCFEDADFTETRLWTHLIRLYGIYISEFAFMSVLFSSELDTLICASVFHSLQTMTNRCISSLIAELTNEMPYELPGLPPRNESPGQFTMGGNWIDCREGEREGACYTHYSPIGFPESVAWKAICEHWMPRVCSLIHVVHFSQTFQSTPVVQPRAGWWLLNGVAFRGPSLLWGNDQQLFHLEMHGNSHGRDGCRGGEGGGGEMTACGDVE